MSTLREALRSGDYRGYAYAYPHKSAYRELPAPVDLRSLWALESRGSLFAYVHIPFCTYRCGFCNLFALGSPAEELVERYVEQLRRQIAVVGALLGEHCFARLALGGGTPSYLTAPQLESVLDAVSARFTIDLQQVPSCIELSPETATPERLRLCRQAGFDRVSMGVQSFLDAELRSLVRPAQGRRVQEAIEVIRALGFPSLNLDLIYGIHGQSTASFAQSVQTALAFEPEELYLYPLYVRPKTGLGKMQQRGELCEQPDARMQMYRIARELLLEAGYVQVSMRMFRAPWAPQGGGPAYCCQDDGMVGLGCGARSYTRSLHYCDRYGVERQSVARILQQYVESPEQCFEQARYGFRLDEQEQRRRYIIQSLLVWPGLNEAAYTARFGTRVLEDLPELSELLDQGLGHRADGVIALTTEGMAHADTIGPWLSSPQVLARMQGQWSG